MSRLSREKKREQEQAARAVTPAAPIDVHVPGAGTDVGGGTGGVSDGASVGGVPVFAAPGEEIQRAVLNRLHHIALAAGHPVLATIRDERIGYVVPLQVDPDGSSHFTAEPVATNPPEPQHARGTDAVKPPEPQHARSGGAPAPPQSQPQSRPTRSDATTAPEPQHPRSDSATHVLRAVPEAGRGSAPTFPLRAVPEPQPADEPVPTFGLRAVPESAEPAPEDAPPAPGAARPPGTVAPPTGEFGPPPPMDARPLPVPEARPAPRPEPVPEDALIAADPDPKPTPARGFDAVAEAVLGDEPLTAPGDPAAPALLAEPVARINEAVREGRIEAAAGLAEQTVTQASGTLGPEHPEVLRLCELTAYIAYLAGDPIRACRLSLDLAGARRRAGDAEAAYGNVESAATAWRAVRDPALGLELGRDLIGLWTELAAEDGPAAEEVEQLESARARMGRLTERARNG
ncbi:tetratricopeptide repeat protein [Streptomyces sp. D2-8]|uniref:tetratricopeptide repeat protein n=1 Tax=Streptomyces sp. D2-8 TaxID=2707767 RepID=UPI0020BEECA2|nr:tetratricopeptide repeat protein [Streptomyces sp. D2-8]MCK8435824.1 tetratricopeptide repeat protein [Streptomyces sp. D2-8]